MPKRRRTLPWLCLAALGAAHAPASAQPAGPVSHVLARHWSYVPGDTAALAQLLQASWETGGETVMRGVLSAAADPGRPYEVRLHALLGLAEFMRADAAHGLRTMLREAGDGPIPECTPSTTWTPGDTIRSCTFPIIILGRRFPRRYHASGSIEPILRDTIRAAVQGLAASDPDPRLGSAAALLWRVIGGTERWSPARAEQCRALAAAAGTPPVPVPMSYSAYAGCEQSGPVLLAAAWRGLRADPAHRQSLLRASQRIRDLRLQAALHEVAMDTARDELARRAALTVLATLADGRMHTSDLRAPGEERCTGSGYGEQEEGGEPMEGIGRGEVRWFMRTLAGSAGTDDPVTREAARLSACLEELSNPGWPRP